MEEKVETREKSGNLTAKERGMKTTTPVKRRRKKSNLPARNGDPSLHTTLRGNVVRRLSLLAVVEAPSDLISSTDRKSSQAPTRDAVQAAQGSAQDEDDRPHHFWVIVEFVFLCRT